MRFSRVFKYDKISIRRNTTTPFTTFITSVKVGNDPKKKTAKAKATTLAGQIDSKKREPVPGANDSEKNANSEKKQEALKKTVYVFGGLVIVGFLLAHGFSTFEGLRDVQQYKQLPGLIDAVIADRKEMLFADTVRSLILMLLSAGFLWFLLKKKFLLSIKQLLSKKK